MLSLNTVFRFFMERDLEERVFQLVKPVAFKGIDEFFDIAPILGDPEVLKIVSEEFVRVVRFLDPTVICALDARGFIFGTLVAIHMGKPLVMIRKANKLPGECWRTSFDKEYESGDSFEIQKGSIKESDNVVVIDDILATGGSMNAAFQLLKKMNPQSVSGVCLIDLNLPGSREYLQEHSVYVKSLFDVISWRNNRE